MNRHVPLLFLLLAGLVAIPAQGSEPAPKAKPGSAAPALSEEEMLQALRERLAAKLGASKSVEPKSPGLVRVTAKAEAPPSDGGHGASASAGGHGAPSAAAPAHGAAVPAAKPVRTASVAAAAHRAAKAAEAPHGTPHWSYVGEAGPKTWGGLKPEFSLCSTGTRQSPIDIKDGIGVDLEPIQFDYRASPFRVVDNGHTVQVNIEPGNSIVARGQRYELVQFHFHRPAEERVNGKSFDMSLHLVHKDSEGRLAVVGLLLDRGDAHPLVQTVWNNLPLEKGEEVGTRSTLDVSHILPADRGYYTYMGSLTTPPCSEGVLWMVMRQPVTLSPDQIAVFSRLYPMNARPIQQAAGRMIKQSN